MKKKILIVEDNFHKAFAISMLLECKLRVELTRTEAASLSDIIEEASRTRPHQVMYCRNGGAAELLKTLEKRNINRRNTEICLVVCEELIPSDCQAVEMLAKSFQRTQKTKSMHEACFAA